MNDNKILCTIAVQNDSTSATDAQV